MELTLSRATIDDLPDLAEINRLSYLPETTAQFAFIDWPAEENMRSFFSIRIKDRLDHLGTQVFKAAIPVTQEIVGFVCWTLEQANEDNSEMTKPVPTPTAVAVHQIPPGLNMEFVKTNAAEMEKMNGHRKGMKHYCECSQPARKASILQLLC